MPVCICVCVHAGFIAFIVNEFTGLTITCDPNTIGCTPSGTESGETVIDVSGVSVCVWCVRVCMCVCVRAPSYHRLHSLQMLRVFLQCSVATCLEPAADVRSSVCVCVCVCVCDVYCCSCWVSVTVVVWDRMLASSSRCSGKGLAL